MTGEHQHGDRQRKLNDGRIGQQRGEDRGNANEASAAREDIRLSAAMTSQMAPAHSPTGQAAAISTP